MNPYTKTIVDEVSGIEVSNELYKAFEAGKKEGRREVVEWLKYVAIYELEGMVHVCSDCHTMLIMPIEKWQAKLRAWGFEEK